MKYNFVRVTFTDIDYWYSFKFAICIAHLQDTFTECVKKQDSKLLKRVITNIMVCEKTNKNLTFRNQESDYLEELRYIEKCLEVSFHSKHEDTDSHHDLVFVYDINIKYFPVEDILYILKNTEQLENGF